MERQADRPTDKHACDSDISGFQEIGGLIKKNCMKMKESGVLRHFPFQEFLKFQELSHP